MIAEATIQYRVRKQVLLRRKHMEEGGKKWPGKGMSEEGEGCVSHLLAEEIKGLAYINKLVGRTTLQEGEILYSRERGRGK